MSSVIINTNNYSGKNANITFYPQTGGTVNVGLVTLPYTYTSDYIYGLYVLFFPEYGTSCQIRFTPTPPSNDLTYILIPDNDFYYQLLLPNPINDLTFNIIPNNDFYYNILIPNPIINDLTFNIIPNNDFYYNVLVPNPIIDDLTFTIILNNDIYASILY